MDVDAGCAEAVSPRLLSAADRTRSKRVSRRFDLKMSEFETADMFERTVHKTVWEVWVLLLELRQTVLLM